MMRLPILALAVALVAAGCGAAPEKSPSSDKGNYPVVRADECYELKEVGEDTYDSTGLLCFYDDVPNRGACTTLRYDRGGSVECKREESQDGTAEG